jgi:hypothetical protein
MIRGLKLDSWSKSVVAKMDPRLQIHRLRVTVDPTIRRLFQVDGLEKALSRRSRSIGDRTYEAARALRRRAMAPGRPRTFMIRPVVS